MTTEEKEIYAIGEIPPLGFVPKKMHAWVIRRDRHGNPMQSFQEEEFDIPDWLYNHDERIIYKKKTKLSLYC